MSRIYVAGRQSGKTTKLIQESAKTGAIIVVANYTMGRHVELMAERLKLKIPTPITVTNYIRILARGGNGKTQKYLVDELQMMLHQMNVEMATLSYDSIETLQHDGFHTKVSFTDEVEK